MEMTAPSSNSGEVRPYAELQGQIHEALRKEHPEWIQPNGESPMCDAYESRLAELLELFEIARTQVDCVIRTC
jgi:hypothetical protein